MTTKLELPERRLFMARRKFSICYKIVVVLLIAIGISLNMIRTVSKISMASYYTIQSNALCFCVFIAHIYFEINNKNYKNNRYYVVKGMIIISILLTGVVYQIGLLPNNFKMDALNNYQVADIANLILHFGTPILTLLDYILFDKKGHFKIYYPIFWLVFPIYYLIYVYIYGNSGGRFFNIGGSDKYAYFFLDYEAIGRICVMRWCILIFVGIGVLSYLLVFIDWLISKKKKEPDS